MTASDLGACPACSRPLTTGGCAFCATGDSAPSSARLISKVIVSSRGAHDYVRVFNRGGLAGVLCVEAGDGQKIAARLRGDDAAARPGW